MHPIVFEEENAQSTAKIGEFRPCCRGRRDREGGRAAIFSPTLGRPSMEKEEKKGNGGVCAVLAWEGEGRGLPLPPLLSYFSSFLSQTPEEERRGSNKAPCYFNFTSKGITLLPLKNRKKYLNGQPET